MTRLSEQLISKGEDHFSSNTPSQLRVDRLDAEYRHQVLQQRKT